MSKSVWLLTTAYFNGCGMDLETSIHSQFHELEDVLFDMGFDNDEIEIIIDKETFNDNEQGFVRIQEVVL